MLIQSQRVFKRVRENPEGLDETADTESQLVTVLELRCTYAPLDDQARRLKGLIVLEGPEGLDTIEVPVEDAANEITALLNHPAFEEVKLDAPPAGEGPKVPEPL